MSKWIGSDWLVIALAGFTALVMLLVFALAFVWLCNEINEAFDHVEGEWEDDAEGPNNGAA